MNYIKVTFLIEKEEGGYAAICRELGTASCGSTIEEAAENIREATSLYVDTLEELGERERIFSERGITILSALPELPEHVDIEFPANTAAFVTRDAIALCA
jgi:predicted RNase H-like HicB family nuclease